MTKMLLSPHSISSSLHGREGWTGVMLAGWQMAQCSTPLSSPDSLAEALIWLLGYAAMEPGINIETVMMSSVLPPLLWVRLNFASLEVNFRTMRNTLLLSFVSKVVMVFFQLRLLNYLCDIKHQSVFHV